MPASAPACPLEDRIALEDLVVAFAHAVDAMDDAGQVLACFTDDGVIDLTGIGMARFEGHAGIRAFYEGAFAANAHMAHVVSNVAVTAWSGDRAAVRSYVTAMARGKDGSAITVHGRYYFDAARTPQGWRFTGYSMDFLIPPG